MAETPLRLDSITDVLPPHAGGVAVSGSHGGLYPAAVASGAGLRAVMFNDAGIGLDRAGIAGLTTLERVGMAAAAAACMSCRIGSADDMMVSGIVSEANRIARRLGVEPGIRVPEALRCMADAPQPRDRLPPHPEARRSLALKPAGPEVILVDSASLVREEDAGAIVVTGSHGGLIGGAPARALKADARVAVFNDAGGGKDDVGYGRLPALDARGIAAVVVFHDTARIGDAASTLRTGVISRANGAATRLGAREGMPLLAWLETFDS